MKIKTTLIFFLCFTTLMVAQKKQFTIETKTGETYVVKKYTSKKDKISFKGKEGKKTISYQDIDKILATGKKEKDNYTLKYIKFSDDNGDLMTELVTGEVSLYLRTVMVVTGSGMYGPTTSTARNYYTLRKGEPVATEIKSNNIFKNFKKDASYFFSDCKGLVSKIENKEFRRKDIAEIVTYYNTSCTGAK